MISESHQRAALAGKIEAAHHQIADSVPIDELNAPGHPLSGNRTTRRSLRQGQMGRPD